MADDAWTKELASNELDVIRAARAGEKYMRLSEQQTKDLAAKLEKDTRRRIAGLPVEKE